MMNERHSKRLAVFTCLSAGVLAACHSTPTRLYTLYPVPPSLAVPRAARDGPTVRVDSVRVPPARDRSEIVTDVAPGELRISDLDHWAAPLGQVARQALSADLLARLPPGRVIFPHLAKPQGALGISVDLLDLTSDGTGTHLQASWQVSPSGAATCTGGASASLHTELSSPDAATAVKALSILLGQLADRIAAEL